MNHSSNGEEVVKNTGENFFNDDDDDDDDFAGYEDLPPLDDGDSTSSEPDEPELGLIDDWAAKHPPNMIRYADPREIVKEKELEAIGPLADYHDEEDDIRYKNLHPNDWIEFEDLEIERFTNVQKTMRNERIPVKFEPGTFKPTADSLYVMDDANLHDYERHQELLPKPRGFTYEWNPETRRYETESGIPQINPDGLTPQDLENLGFTAEDVRNLPPDWCLDPETNRRLEPIPRYVDRLPFLRRARARTHAFLRIHTHTHTTEDETDLFPAINVDYWADPDWKEVALEKTPEEALREKDLYYLLKNELKAWQIRKKDVPIVVDPLKRKKRPGQAAPHGFSRRAVVEEEGPSRGPGPDDLDRDGLPVHRPRRKAYLPTRRTDPSTRRPRRRSSRRTPSIKRGERTTRFTPSTSPSSGGEPFCATTRSQTRSPFRRSAALTSGLGVARRKLVDACGAVWRFSPAADNA